jgi:hypothetical protein
VIDGVDFDALSENATLIAAFKAACGSAVAQAVGVGGVMADHVAVGLSEGSVLVSYTITVPANAVLTTELVMRNLKGAGDDYTLSEWLVSEVASAPGIASVSHGAITVSDVQAPTLGSVSASASPWDGAEGPTWDSQAAVLLSILLTVLLVGFLSFCLCRQKIVKKLRGADLRQEPRYSPLSSEEKEVIGEDENDAGSPASPRSLASPAHQGKKVADKHRHLLGFLS